MTGMFRHGSKFKVFLIFKQPILLLAAQRHGAATTPVVSSLTNVARYGKRRALSKSNRRHFFW